MVANLKIEDQDKFNKLGLLVNPNFNRLFSLKEILASSSDYLIGYYNENELIGFLHFTKSFETIDIINIVVNQEYRNQGIATILINHLLTMFNDIEQILLEVNENNLPAINLYKKNKFQEIYRRTKYYGDEDALIMKRDV